MTFLYKLEKSLKILINRKHEIGKNRVYSKIKILCFSQISQYRDRLTLFIKFSCYIHILHHNLQFTSHSILHKDGHPQGAIDPLPETAALLPVLSAVVLNDVERSHLPG